MALFIVLVKLQLGISLYNFVYYLTKQWICQKFRYGLKLITFIFFKIIFGIEPITNGLSLINILIFATHIYRLIFLVCCVLLFIARLKYLPKWEKKPI